MSWEKYQKTLNELMVMSEVSKMDASMGSRVQISPESEVAFQHQLVNPDQDEGIINKNLRIGNLNPRDHAKVNIGGYFFTYLEGLKESQNMQKSKNLNILQLEVMKDINIVQNSSVSRGGWFLQELLSPKKRFQMLPDRSDKKLLEKDK